FGDRFGKRLATEEQRPVNGSRTFAIGIGVDARRLNEVSALVDTDVALPDRVRAAKVVRVTPRSAASLGPKVVRLVRVKHASVKVALSRNDLAGAELRDRETNHLRVEDVGSLDPTDSAGAGAGQKVRLQGTIVHADLIGATNQGRPDNLVQRIPHVVGENVGDTGINVRQREELKLPSLQNNIAILAKSNGDAARRRHTNGIRIDRLGKLRSLRRKVVIELHNDRAARHSLLSRRTV